MSHEPEESSTSTSASKKRMRDSIIVTHADVYDELPSTSSADNMMMSSDSSPSLPLATPNYVELPEEPRPGKISPSTNSSGSPRAASKSDNRSSPEADPDETDTIEEAVPIVRSTLPSPEPRPTIERNGGYKNSSMTDDRVDGSATNGLSSNNNNGIKPLPYQQHRDIDEDSCLIKCIYFTQQCCECTIV